ncbi:MAG: hypothetical protein K6A65_02750 [Succinivibrionaceae bacterium]|nr:hypothetical protein [Succinivibrionaceae bacterium]
MEGSQPGIQEGKDKRRQKKIFLSEAEQGMLTDLAREAGVTESRVVAHLIACAHGGGDGSGANPVREALLQGIRQEAEGLGAGARYQREWRRRQRPGGGDATQELTALRQRNMQALNERRGCSSLGAEAQRRLGERLRESSAAYQRGILGKAPGEEGNHGGRD